MNEKKEKFMRKLARESGLEKETRYHAIAMNPKKPNRKSLIMWGGCQRAYLKRVVKKHMRELVR